MEITLVLLMVLGVGGMLWRSSAARAEAVRTRTEQLAKRLGARVGKSRWSDQTAFFEHEGMLCGIYFAYGDPEEFTGVFFRFEEGEVPPGVGSVRVLRRGRSSVADYADRPKGTGTGDAAFDGEFEVTCSKDDRGFAYRWLDPEGRRLVRELVRYQAATEEPRLEYLGGERTLRLWGTEHVNDEVQLAPLLEYGARLARRITGKPAPVSDDPVDEDGPLEV